VQGVQESQGHKERWNVQEMLHADKHQAGDNAHETILEGKSGDHDIAGY
jgi:hypothetical protein